jgi:hypothetical protein
MKKGTDRGMRRWRAVALVAAGLTIGVTMMATSAGAHVGGTVTHLWGHLKPITDARYANAVSGTDKAKDADKLDALDSAAFWQKTENVNAATLGGTADSGFWRKAEAVNATTLGGTSAAGFIRKSEAFSQVQLTNTLTAGQTHNWFTHSWPSNWFVEWQGRPTTQGGRIRTSVELEQGASGTYTYHISVTNVSAITTNYELRAYRFAIG